MTRYSDRELEEFRTILNARIKTAEDELQLLRSIISRDEDNGAEDTGNPYKNLEDGSATYQTEQIIMLARRQNEFLCKLKDALIRIENKTYGICRVTGKLIDKARLRAVPHSTLSIEAKKQMKK